MLKMFSVTINKFDWWVQVIHFGVFLELYYYMLKWYDLFSKNYTFKWNQNKLLTVLNRIFYSAVIVEKCFYCIFSIALLYIYSLPSLSTQHLRIRLNPLLIFSIWSSFYPFFFSRSACNTSKNTQYQPRSSYIVIKLEPHPEILLF